MSNPSKPRKPGHLDCGAHLDWVTLHALALTFQQKILDRAEPMPEELLRSQNFRAAFAARDQVAPLETICSLAFSHAVSKESSNTLIHTTCLSNNLPLKTPSPGEVNLLQTYSPCYPKS